MNRSDPTKLLAASRAMPLYLHWMHDLYFTPGGLKHRQWLHGWYRTDVVLRPERYRDDPSVWLWRDAGANIAACRASAAGG